MICAIPSLTNAYVDNDEYFRQYWLAMVKNSIATVTPRFSARRMLKDYVRHAYGPAINSRVGPVSI